MSRTVPLVSRRVLIVQHAEKQRLPGDPGLTASGVTQATVTAEWLAEHEDLVAVWASPLRRAVETAAPIARMTGCRLITDIRLRERMNWDDPHVESLEEFLVEWRKASDDRDYVPRSGDSSGLPPSASWMRLETSSGPTRTEPGLSRRTAASRSTPCAVCSVTINS